MTIYAQSVDGIVNLIGGPEVGLTGVLNNGNVIVRNVTLYKPLPEIGWIDDPQNDCFVAPPHKDLKDEPEPVLLSPQELQGKLLANLILEVAKINAKLGG